MRFSFARRPPRFRGVHFTSVKAVDNPCLACGDRSPTGEGRDRAGPSCRYEVRVLQPLLHCTQEKWWLRPIWDLRVLNRSLQSYRSRCSRRNAFSSASVPRLVCSDRPEGRVLSCLDSSSTQAVSALCVRGSSISVQGPTLRAGPVSPASSRKSWREPLFPWENRASASSTISTTGSFSLSLGNSYANTGIWCSVTSASWAFRSTGKRANSPQCRGSLFSVWSWIRSNSQHASQRNVLSRCWTAWIHSGAGQRSHWNFFRGSWGIWRPQRQ